MINSNKVKYVVSYSGYMFRSNTIFVFWLCVSCQSTFDACFSSVFRSRFCFGYVPDRSGLEVIICIVSSLGRENACAVYALMRVTIRGIQGVYGQFKKKKTAPVSRPVKITDKSAILVLPSKLLSKPISSTPPVPPPLPPLLVACCSTFTSTAVC